MQEASIVCKNCGNQFNGKFCNNCGEKVYTEHDKTFGHFLGETFHFITHWDNKLIKSWWLVMSKPGFVSSQIAYGVRKPYYKPANLFIIGVILYLLFPFFTGLNMPMKYHMTGFFYGELADHMIFYKMAARHLTLDQLAEKFDHRSPAFAKVLLLIIIPLSAFALQLLFRKKKRYFFDHITLASELNTFYLFFTFFGIPLLFIIAYLVARLMGLDIKNYLNDDISIPLHLVVVGTYAVIAFRRFYNEKTFRAIMKTTLFLGAHYIIVYALYRFILFCLVMLTI